MPNLPQSPHPPDSRATRPPRHSGRPIALRRRHRRRELVNGLQLRNIGPTKLRRETGLVAGFSVEASLARFASLPPEIVYVQKGVRLDGPFVAGAIATDAGALVDGGF